jgi:hypothetical protein
MMPGGPDTADRTVRQSDRRSAELLGSDADLRDASEDLLRRGMTAYLFERKIKIFDYPKVAQPFRDELRGNAERLASENGIEIEFLRLAECA